MLNLRWMTFFLLFAFFAAPALALNVPPLQGRVNDQARLLTPEQAAALEEKLRAYEAKTTNQIALLTVPSLEGEPLEDFSIRVAREWQLGQEKRNNGVLIFIAAEERGVRIEVGYGLEGALTDAQSSIIIRNIMIPAFREGDFNRGIESAVDAIQAAIAGEFKAPEVPSSSRSRDDFNEVFSLGLILLILFSSFLSYLPLPITALAGGIIGGVVGSFLIGAIFLPVLIGIFLGIVLPLLFRGSGGGPGRGLGGRAYRGTGWSVGRGWSGGRGGFRGGGFSGGGGSFGGGGASGRW
jgi:uncharacterized protein